MKVLIPAGRCGRCALSLAEEAELRLPLDLLCGRAAALRAIQAKVRCRDAGCLGDADELPKRGRARECCCCCCHFKRWSFAKSELLG